MNNRRLFLAIATLTLSMRAAAQTPANTRATIQGTVMKAGAGQPLKRARVSLRRSGQQAQPNNNAVQALAVVEAVSGALNSAGIPNGLPPGMEQRLQGLGAQSTQAVTDDSGRFVFNGVEPGQYRISVDRDGYVRQEYGQRTFNGPGIVISVSAGQRIQNVDFQLVPAGSISGRVFNEDGEPLANVQVQAQTYTYQQGKRVLGPAGPQATTNDLGEYRIYWLTPGEYFISATARRGVLPAINSVVTQQSEPQRGQGQRGGATPAGPPQNEETYAPTYFPGTVSPESASPVVLAPTGEVRGIDMNLRPTPTVTVRGQVLVPGGPAQPAGPNPQPAGRGGRGFAGGRGQQVNVVLARIGAGRNFGGGMNRTTVRPDGTFDIAGVVPGSYNLMAVARTEAGPSAAKTRIDVGDRGVDNVTLALRPGIPISGKVFIDGTPPPNFKLGQLRVNLQPTEDFPNAGTNGGTGQVAEDGSFTLPSVTPMEYRARVNGLPAGAYVMTGRIGNDDAVNQPFTIAGDQQVSLQLQIGFAAGRVQGTVVDEKGNAFQGALAALIPEEPRRQRTELFFAIPTDQYGRFSFAGIPPGAYKLFAWESIPNGAHQDPDFVARFEDRGKPIKIDANGSIDAQLNVIRQ